MYDLLFLKVELDAFERKDGRRKKCHYNHIFVN